MQERLVPRWPRYKPCHECVAFAAGFVLGLCVSSLAGLVIAWCLP